MICIGKTKLTCEKLEILRLNALVVIVVLHVLAEEGRHGIVLKCVPQVQHTHSTNQIPKLWRCRCLASVVDDKASLTHLVAIA